MAVRHAFEALLGLPCEAVQALEFAAYGTAGADTLVIGISAGGNTPAVMAALHMARARGALAIGISNAPGSPILTAFDAGLVVHATRRGWPTQSSTATMALLIALAAGIAGKRHDLAGLAGLLDTLPATVDAEMRDIAASIAARPLLLFAGLGPNFAAASIGAAKIRELSPIHAMAFPLEELHHYRTPKAGDVLVLVATDPPSLERALDTALVSESRGGHIIALLSADAPDIAARVQAVVRLPPVDPMLSAFPSMVALHLLAYHFARARDALGLGAA
jgi:glucosamine--fructose-6-phosphate aminotransferase (isomerizing)